MNQTISELQVHFALCIRKGDDDDLELRKAYVVLPADSNEAGYVRVVDESGEDYLYLSDYFLKQGYFDED